MLEGCGIDSKVPSLSDQWPQDLRRKPLRLGKGRSAQASGLVDVLGSRYWGCWGQALERMSLG